MEAAAASVRALGEEILAASGAGEGGLWPLPGSEVARSLVRLNVWAPELRDAQEMELSADSMLQCNLLDTASIACTAGLQCDLGAERALAQTTAEDLEGIPLEFTGRDGVRRPLMPEQMGIARLLVAGAPLTTLYGPGRRRWAGGNADAELPSFALVGAPMGTGKTLAVLAGALALLTPGRFDRLADSAASWAGRPYNDDPTRVEGAEEPHDVAAPAPPETRLPRAVLVVAIRSLHAQWCMAAEALGAKVQVAALPKAVNTLLAGGGVVVCEPSVLSKCLKAEAQKKWHNNARRTGAAALIIDELAHMGGLPSSRTVTPLNWGAFPRVVAITASARSIAEGRRPGGGCTLGMCRVGNVVRRAVYATTSTCSPQAVRLTARRLQLMSLPFALQQRLTARAARLMRPTVLVRNVRASGANLIALEGTLPPLPTQRVVGYRHLALPYTFKGAAGIPLQHMSSSIIKFWNLPPPGGPLVSPNTHTLLCPLSEPFGHQHAVLRAPLGDAILHDSWVPCAALRALEQSSPRPCSWADIVESLPCDCGAPSAAAVCKGCCATACAACAAKGRCFACSSALPLWTRGTDPWAENGPPLQPAAGPSTALRVAVEVHQAMRTMIVMDDQFETGLEPLRAMAKELQVSMYMVSEHLTLDQFVDHEVAAEAAAEAGAPPPAWPESREGVRGFLDHPADSRAVLVVPHSSRALAGMDLGMLDVVATLGDPHDPQQTFSRGLRAGTLGRPPLVILRLHPSWDPPRGPPPSVAPVEDAQPDAAEASLFVEQGRRALLRPARELEGPEGELTPFRPPKALRLALVPSRATDLVLRYQLRLPACEAVDAGDESIEFTFCRELRDGALPQGARGLVIYADGTAEWRNAQRCPLRIPGVGSCLSVSMTTEEGVLETKAQLAAETVVHHQGSVRSKRRRT